MFLRLWLASYRSFLQNISLVERLTKVERFAIVKRMEVTISDKYQVVIPKEARKKLGIKPGQKITVKRVSPTSITFERQPSMEELIERSRGTLINAPWDKEGVDPATWLRRERDKE